MGNVYIFPPYEMLKTPRTVFQRYQTSTFRSLAMHNPRQLFILGCVLISERGRFNVVTWDFFIVSNEHHLNPEVFMNS